MTWILLLKTTLTCGNFSILCNCGAPNERQRSHNVLHARTNVDFGCVRGCSSSAPNLKSLMRSKALRGKVAVRIAGDVHNYMRHTRQSIPSVSEKRRAQDAGAAQVLIVSGNGGAFLHPTHTFPRTFKETSAVYKRRAAYPSDAKSITVGLKNILSFRSLNWKFDLLGVILYFSILASFFPRCHLRHIIHADALFPNGVSLFFAEVASMYGDMLMENWATPSLIVYVVVTILLVGFTDTHIGFGRRLFVGILHSSLHTICAFSLFLLLNMTIMIALEDGILSPVDKNALFEGSRGTPLTGVYEWDAAVQPMLKFMLRVFDLPQAMGFGHATMCCKDQSRTSLL